MAVTEKKRASGFVRALRLIVIVFAVCCIALAAYLYFVPQEEAALSEMALFQEGVYVNGISLGGKTMEEGAALLYEEEQRLLKDVQFVLEPPGSTVMLTAADMTVSFDTAALLEQAMLLGNVGSRAEREAERAELAGSPKRLTISMEVDVSPLRGKVSQIAALVNTPPIDASVEMDMNMEGWFKYTDGQPGQTLDEEALLAALQERAKTGEYGQVPLPILMEQPAVTVQTLQASMQRRAKAETSFKKSPYNKSDRVFNVKKAAGLINGTVLKPGEEFSTNDTLGPRTYELGWKAAPAYVRGTTEDQAGGGVCQISSTLYNAVVKADLEITYRRNHSSTVSYVPYGLDATINTGTIDFTFRNNTNSDIYIFAYTFDAADGKVPEGQQDKTVHVEVFGEGFPEEYDEIRLTAEKVETVKPKGEMEVVVDNNAAWDYYKEEVARKNGAIYQSYKHYYKDGVEVKVERLAKSTYSAWAGRIIVGPGYYASTIPVLE